MKMLYSALTGGFYDDSSDFPADVVTISSEEHQSLLEGQASGKLIAADSKGFPVLIDLPPRSSEASAAIERKWRDEQLLVTDGVVSRHRDELEEGADTTLAAEQYSELQGYRRALRNWPESGEFPLIDHRPPTPLWLTDQLQ